MSLKSNSTVYDHETLVVNATDASSIHSVQVYDGTTYLGDATRTGAGQYTFTGNLSEGAHVLKVVATDQAGWTSSFNQNVTITVPALVVTGISPDTGVAGDLITASRNPLVISGTAAPGATVALSYTSGSDATVHTLGSAVTADSSGHWQATAGVLPDGVYHFTADAKYDLTDKSTTFDVTVDRAAPTVTLTSITDGADPVGTDMVTALSGVSFHGSATPGATVTVFVDGVANPDDTVTADGSGHFTDAYAPALSAGTHNVRLVATDLAGNQTSSHVQSFIAAGAQYGGDGNDTLTGGGGADLLYGLGGDDTLIGGAGDDLLDGGTGVNTASYAKAAAGVTVDLSLANPQDTHGDGVDTLVSIQNLTGSKFDDTLAGDGGNNLLNGGTGTDTVTYASAAAGVTVNLAKASAQDTVGAGVDTLKAIENLTGSGYGDHLTGSSGDNVLQGLGGDDTLDGGAGNDTLDGGSGVDTASYAAAAAGVTVSLAVTDPQDTHGAGTDTLASIENLTGSSHDDVLTGDAGNNVLSGGAGNDVLDGGAGDDSLIGGSGTDTASYASAASGVTVTLAGAAAQDTLGAGTDTLSSIENLTGSAFNDHLTGDAAANVLSGGDGDDVLSGGTGQDTLTGGAGNDSFVFAHVNQSTVAAPDLITDFGSGDIIDLHSIDANTAIAGNQAFHLASAAGAGALVIAYDAVHDRTVLDLYVDADATADAEIWLSGNHAGLTAADFLL